MGLANGPEMRFKWYHTRAIEIVANAKGSPTMLPKVKAELLRYSTILSYFFRDGECSDPYPGMKDWWCWQRESRETPRIDRERHECRDRG